MEKFQYNFSTNQWVHQSEQGLTGVVGEVCGIIGLSYLEKDPRKGYSDFSWNYRSRKIIGNKAGKILGVNCFEFNSDENENTYYGIRSLEYESLKLVNCKFIDLASSGLSD